MEWPGKNADLDIQFTQSAVGYDFVKTMKLQLVKGRDFSKEFATDSAGYLLNESAVKIIGYKDPIGKPLTFLGNERHHHRYCKGFSFQFSAYGDQPPGTP